MMTLPAVSLEMLRAERMGMPPSTRVPKVLEKRAMEMAFVRGPMKGSLNFSLSMKTFACLVSSHFLNMAIATKISASTSHQ